MRASCPDTTVEEFAETEDVPAGAVYDALADERRRTTLAALAATSPPVDVDALAIAVANREADPPRDGLPEARVGRVRESLRQRHLPALDDAGLIASDGENTVTWVVDGLDDLLA